ncbi:3-dehydroquinate synthase [Enterobacteriaceae endosymbiont of Plateumaris sericea]|uniref:3-dehydroquinate synthase n=1 Tax=Enterobacteriaceae endosymbiont of Plateumaris sericea TaxID=2675797 RepID=UPI00144916DF|nr:3-dehydroquinate synthase [Enterobacteriaceae endosymbiont of Plateumaris sericea]QJC30076.1 3-dehydroquinate synthase [Enterobacteriaceae endosymbiont of Plateumaris sericea]
MVKTILVKTKKHNYPINIGFDLFKTPYLFSNFKHGDQAMIVTNQKIFTLYFKKLSDILQYIGIKLDYIILPDGEKYKTLITMNIIYSSLLKKLHSRDTTLISLGGGVIGDITGFAASSYQRGVKLIQIPTTLLSQVDASIGGKTAVNHDLGKNMIGSFYQPNAVMINLNYLDTLSKREFSSGMAEVIKYSIIFDNIFFSWLEKNIDKLFNLDQKSIKYCIYKCCKFKSKIVCKDENEKNTRVLLNLGHTYGHAIESETNYNGKWLHGEAISVGIIMSCITSEKLNLFSNNDTIRIINLLKRCNLPVQNPKFMNTKKYLKYMFLDKKVHNNKIHLIIPVKIGKVIINNNITENIISDSIRQLNNLI